jgi:hypothetical protein
MAHPAKVSVRVFASELTQEVRQDLSAALREALLGLASAWFRESAVAPVASSGRPARASVAVLTAELVPEPRWFH